MEEVKYFLVLEKRIGDYNLIDISKLDICNDTITTDLGSIDSFTCRFSEEEIKNSIVRSNIARPEYLEGSLKIISDKHHHFNILTKELYTTIMEFQTNDMEIDQTLKNKIFGYYKKVVEVSFKDEDFIKGLLERFKNCLKIADKMEIFKIIEELPYPKSRNIYIMIYEEIKKRKNENLRKLEKQSANE